MKEEGHIFSDEKEPRNLMNSFFINIIAELDLKKDTENFLGTTITLDDPLKKFQYHNIIQV